VARIFSQADYEDLAREYRSEIMLRLVPLAMKSLEKLIKKADRVAVMHTPSRRKDLLQHREMELNSRQLPERDYADAMVKYYESMQYRTGNAILIAHSTTANTSLNGRKGSPKFLSQQPQTCSAKLVGTRNVRPQF
jgi:hypothetical protein